jgi:hypothetical protein
MQFICIVEHVTSNCIDNYYYYHHHHYLLYAGYLYTYSSDKQCP